MRGVGIAEGDAANDPQLVGEPEMRAQEGRVIRECSLGDARDAERLRGEHEVSHIGAAIDRAIGAERLVGRDQRHMRRAEEAEILARLAGIGRLVAPRDADRVVKGKAAFAPAREIRLAIFARKRAPRSRASASASAPFVEPVRSVRSCMMRSLAR